MIQTAFMSWPRRVRLRWRSPAVAGDPPHVPERA